MGEKNDRKLNAVSYFLISVWTVMCYQLSVAVLVDTLHIGVSIVSVGIMNYALALGCTFYTIYKRERQKYEIHIFDILVLLVLAGIAVFGEEVSLDGNLTVLIINLQLTVQGI